MGNWKIKNDLIFMVIMASGTARGLVLVIT